MLTIALEKVCFIVVEAREFDVKVEPADSGEPGSNPADDREVGVIEDRADGPAFEELTGALEALDEDELLDLLALAWIGRGDFAGTEWRQAREQARAVCDKRIPSYLAGPPLLSDYLQEGPSQRGQSCQEFELGRM